MKSLLLFTVLFFALNLPAQNISGTDISKDSSIQYIDVTVTHKVNLFRVNMDVFVNYGQEEETVKGGFIRDARGKKMEFISRPAVLNYLYEAGWKVHTTYPLEIPNGFATYYFMERRK